MPEKGMITPNEDGDRDGSAEEDDGEDPAAAAVTALVRALPPNTSRHYQLLPPATAEFPPACPAPAYLKLFLC